MKPSRQVALWFGVLYIITFITSIPALLLYDPAINDRNYVLTGGHDNRIFLGALLELLLIISNLGTALVPYSILKRESERLALSYVTARIMECAFIAVGILAVLSVVTLRRDMGGAAATDSSSLLVAARSLVAIKDWTFLLGPGFVVGVGNGLTLGYLMYRAQLMPRQLTMIGMVGGALICISGTLVLFDVIDLGGKGQGVMSIPEIIWEASIGLWLTIKGFTASPIADAYDADPGRDAVPGVA